MMKKFMAVFIVLFVGVTSFVLVSGYLDKDKESSTNSSAASAIQQQTGATNPATANTKRYTTDEVKAHSTKNDCWLIINNQVYDVTAFISEHPGGSKEITRVCGTDATQAFDTQGGEGEHSSQAKSMLADYLIGSL